MKNFLSVLFFASVTMALSFGSLQCDEVEAQVPETDPAQVSEKAVPTQNAIEVSHLFVCGKCKDKKKR